jgi:hypothetical protein
LEYVEIYQDIDREVRQINFLHPKQNNLSASNHSHPRKAGNPLFTPLGRPSSAPNAATTVATIPTGPNADVLPPLPGGEPMDLSQAQAAVRGLSTRVPGVREICERFRLCFYCKLQHPGVNARDCPNKGKRKTALRSAGLYDETVDAQSIDGDVAVDSGKG